MKKIGLTADQMDALKEVVSIGAGNAATALSKMISTKISIDVPKVSFSTIDETVDRFGDPETLVTSVYLQLLGDMTGVLLFSFRKDTAITLASLLLGRRPGQTRVLDDLGQSAMKETGSILAGAYLSAIGSLLKIRLTISSPDIAHDMAGAVIEDVLLETNKEADYSLIIDTNLTIIDKKVAAYFFFIPDHDSLNKMLKRLGVQK